MTVPVATTIDAVRQAVMKARQQGKCIALVPTMGALHAGHASLIKAARGEGVFVVVSIFVNPTQFGPNEDFTRYPRPIEKDLAVCEVEGVDLVFAPSASEIYPAGHVTFVEVTKLQDVLCGASRPGHFRGVTTVVLKLFNIVQPDDAFFGQKDAQQVRIIEQMVADLNVPVRIAVCPIVREADGLALSSRNEYLGADQRRHAVVLYQSLRDAQTRIKAGERNAAAVVDAMRKRIESTPGAGVDYVAAVNAENLQPVERLQGQVLLAVAIRFGTTRLIDNVLLDTDHPT